MKKHKKQYRIKPDFYDEFQCTAGDCPITCCQQWKIEVDDATYHKWGHFKLTQGPEGSIQSHVTYQDDIGRIRLTPEKLCPFLNQQNLCELVVELGDQVLSDTCTRFPREIHYFNNRTEYSLVSCCPSVVDFLNRKQPITFSEDMLAVSGDFLFQLRNYLITILQNKEYSLQKAFMMDFYLLLELLEEGKRTTKELEKYQSREFFDHLADTIDQMQFFSLDTMDERNELFLDLSENYRKEGLYDSYLDDIAKIAEQLCEEYEADIMEEQIDGFHHQVQEYDHLFRNYLTSEIYQNCVKPETDLQDMIIMFEWIAMQYVTIYHAIFLKWMLEKKRSISYAYVRDYIVIISRLMGYDDVDLMEYMENSFDNIIWDWGYLALILGNNE